MGHQKNTECPKKCMPDVEYIPHENTFLRCISKSETTVG